MLSIEKIEGVIWDMDGVLHPYIPFEQALPFWDRAASRAFNKAATAAGIRHDLTEDQIYRMASQSFKNLGHSTAVFTRDYPISELQMHLEFHRETILEEVISAHADLPAYLESTSHLKHIILTHGSEEWAERCLSKNGIRHYFNNVVSFERVDMQKKSDSEVPVRKAIELIGLPADKLAMVEDTKKNLIIPKRLGIQTVFVEENGLESEWIKMPTSEDEYVDASVKTATDFLKQLAAVPA